jgi:hypothetical protein
MSYYIYELVEGPDYPALKRRQRALAWTTAKSHLRRAALDVPDVICVYGAEVSEDAMESAVEKETGLKTPWLRYTLDEFVARLKEDLPTYHDEAPAPAPMDVTMAPEEAPAAADVTMAPGDVTMAPPAEALAAPADVVMAPAEAPAAADEISLAQEFLRGRFAAGKLAAPVRRGRPKAPTTCAGCKLEFRSSDAKYNHVRRGKCIPV